MEHIWNKSRICPENVPDLFRKTSGTFPELFRNMSGNVSRHNRKCSGAFPDLFRNISEKHLKHIRTFSGAFPNIFRIISGTVPDFCPAMSWTVSGYVPEKFRKKSWISPDMFWNISENKSGNFRIFSGKISESNAFVVFVP